MGCWNGTCLISNMPILSGEEVVGYIIKYTTDKISNEPSSYSHDYANPISLPIRGYYDDYGGIERFEKGLAAKLASLELNVPANDIIRSLERGEVPGHGLVMIHASIHDGLVSAIQKEMSTSGYYGLPLYLSVEDTFKHLKQELEVDEAYEAAAKNSLNIKKLKEMLVESKLQRLDSIGAYSGVLRLRQLFRKANKKNRKKLVEEYVRGANDLSAISKCMSRMRKLWFIPSGAGSQNEDFEYYLLLAELMRKQAFKSIGDSPEDTAHIYKTLLNISGEVA